MRYFNSIRTTNSVSLEKAKIQRKCFKILNKGGLLKIIFFYLFEAGIVNFGICFEFLWTSGFVLTFDLQLS